MATPTSTTANQPKTSNKFEDAGKRVVELSDNLSEAANSAGRKVRSFIDSATTEINDAAETAAQQIRNKPIQSSAIALGVGFLLGVLLSR